MILYIYILEKYDKRINMYSFTYSTSRDKIITYGVDFMFKKLNILDEKDKRLRQISKDATFPLSEKEQKLIEDAVTHLTYSQIEEYEKKYDLRPGMGLAFPQLGINKRIIVIVDEYDEGKFDNYIVINPVIDNNEEKFKNKMFKTLLIVVIQKK